ncbi:MAG TPA: hypothetical protein PK156_35400, partial [Polyangium sp.]|nr:hypothetical protein [Polyangium sp.]
MTTTAPGFGTGFLKTRASRSTRSSRSSRSSVIKLDSGNGRRAIGRALEVDHDPTFYPTSEVMSRDVVESNVASKLHAVLVRHQASRGVRCYTGSDNFIYWQKGDNKLCVSPDLYILPGLEPDAYPRDFVGGQDDGCWKTWVLGVTPSFALEVKARRNPRKDEQQSPDRHDACGTKELIVFDPFHARRRKQRKRFVVYRRDATGKLVPVVETNESRVFSEVLDGYLVAEGDAQRALLRLAIGPDGQTILPFETELVALEAKRANEQTRRAEVEARRAEEEARLRQDAIRRAE